MNALLADPQTLPAVAVGAAVGALLLVALRLGTDAWTRVSADGRFRWAVLLLPAHLPLAVVVLAGLGRVLPHAPLLLGVFASWIVGLAVAWAQRPMEAA
jgi:hypothetical protein